MRRPKFSDKQIRAILKQNENGVTVQDLCREHGMSPDELSAPTCINQV